MPKPIEVQYLTIHGHERAFIKIGEGPALLLLHGLGCDHTTWLPVIGDLGPALHVIAPDLLATAVGDKPRADYSVGGYANGMRDLLTVLDIDKVTRRRPQLRRRRRDAVRLPVPRAHRADDPGRPGGLGPEVTPFIRAITLPGFHQVMGVATLPGVRHVRQGRPAGRCPAPAAARPATSTRSPRSSSPSRTRRPARDPPRGAARRRLEGQIVTMVDRAYLTQAMPMLVVWGTDDASSRSSTPDRRRGSPRAPPSR